MIFRPRNASNEARFGQMGRVMTKTQSQRMPEGQIRQSQMGTGSVASMKMRIRMRPPATVPVPFCDGPSVCHGKMGTGTVAMTFLPILYKFAPRSQSPFFR